jgi:molecular chaperone DnaK (HSP70)
MRDIYDIIVQGIKDEEGLSENGLLVRLKQLQLSVKTLRNAYRNYPVHVPYERIDIQAAYLITYFPHYYLLIYKVLIEDYPSIFEGKNKVKLVYFGGGPGPEIYGTIKYIINNRPEVKIIDVVLFDINATQWRYSHNILQKNILPAIVNSEIQVNISFKHCDLTKQFDEKSNADHINGCDLMVFQNCMNEIPIASINQLKVNFQRIYNLMPSNSSLLLSDLTGGSPAVTSLMQNLEYQIISNDSPTLLHSIIENSSCQTMLSVHHSPSFIVQQNLLVGTDGLIPRKWLKYNYCFLQKSQDKKKPQTLIENGLQAIYSPLNFANRDANNYLNEKTFIGIDFGTSTTVVSLARVVGSEIITQTIPIKQKDDRGYSCYHPLIQSAIALKDSYLLFGIHAYELKSELRRNVDIWHSFKMELGTNNNMQYPNSLLFNNIDYPIKDTCDVITMFFKYLKSEIDKYIKKFHLPEKTEFVVSIPASFLESERMDLLRCLEKAEIVVGNNPFIDEPIAAVLNYLFESKNVSVIENQKNIMVIDCGAGTCDISILEVGKNSKGAYAKNLSISRFGKIGGKLLDKMIAKDVLWKQLQLTHKSIQNISAAEKESLIESLCEIGENLKIKLCKSINVGDYNNYQLSEIAKSAEIVRIPDVTIKANDGTILSFVEPTITYEQFYKIMKEYCSFSITDHIPESTINFSIQSALNKAALKKSDISNVLLTGGSMRNPYFLSFISEYFDNSVIIRPDNIQEHVSKGAAIHSLVLNVFGTNLIRPILSDDLYIYTQNEKIVLFPAGTEIPSRDKRIEISSINSVQKFIEIPIYNSTLKMPLKSILFPCNIESKYKVLFYITPEKWLDCEVTENDNEISHKVQFPTVINEFYSFKILLTDK